MSDASQDPPLHADDARQAEMEAAERADRGEAPGPAELEGQAEGISERMAETNEEGDDSVDGRTV